MIRVSRIRFSTPPGCAVYFKASSFCVPVSPPTSFHHSSDIAGDFSSRHTGDGRANVLVRLFRCFFLAISGLANSRPLRLLTSPGICCSLTFNFNSTARLFRLHCLFRSFYLRLRCSSSLRQSSWFLSRTVISVADWKSVDARSGQGMPEGSGVSSRVFGELLQSQFQDWRSDGSGRGWYPSSFDSNTRPVVQFRLLAVRSHLPGHDCTRGAVVVRGWSQFWEQVPTVTFSPTP